MRDIEVKALHNIDFEIIMDCFLKSFANYFVPMPTDHLFYQERWRNSNVNYRLSFGAFIENKLVGFIINCVDHRNDLLIAYNSGTGVLPEYRGLGLVKKMYQHALPILKYHGVKQCLLEVITANKIAVKAYEKVGFKKVKTYKCYKGLLSTHRFSKDYKLLKVDHLNHDWINKRQKLYSWDNHMIALDRGKCEKFILTNDKTIASYFIINPDTGYLSQLEVFENNEASWTNLLCGIQKICKSIRINNVEESLVYKNKYLRAFGLKNTVDQYEMSLLL